MKINTNKFYCLLALKELSLRDLSKLSSTSLATLTKLCKGNSKVHFKTLGKISKALNVNPQELIKED